MVDERLLGQQQYRITFRRYCHRYVHRSGENNQRRRHRCGEALRARFDQRNLCAFDLRLPDGKPFRSRFPCYRRPEPHSRWRRPDHSNAERRRRSVGRNHYRIGRLHAGHLHGRELDGRHELGRYAGQRGKLHLLQPDAGKKRSGQCSESRKRRLDRRKAHGYDRHAQSERRPHGHRRHRDRGRRRARYRRLQPFRGKHHRTRSGRGP